MMCESTTGFVYEDSTFTLMSRFEVDGANGVRADCVSIQMKAWKTTDFDNTVLDAALTVSSVVFDALQTDGRWTADTGTGSGYNFRYDVADTICTDAGALYLFEAVIETSGGSLPPMTWEVTCKETRSS